jgi:tRNA-2-methylthio-N6-dimethylallyladenosine synthase
MSSRTGREPGTAAPGKTNREGNMSTPLFFHIRTFGCQMNVHDSEQLRELLRRSGHVETARERKADLIVVNTCSIRRKAEQKVFSLLGRFKNLKEANPALLIAVCGCMAQKFQGELIEQFPQVDLVAGTHNIDRIPALLNRLRNGGGPLVETDFRESVPSIGIVAPPAPGRVSAWVTIMQGCNNFCAFCVVPHLRGREESRPLRDVLGEIEVLADGGVREVTLLGQNVNSYGATLGNGDTFPRLLREIDAVEGLERIRFTTSHPKDLSDELIDCFRSVKKLCGHIHLPVQSGSDRILRRMNRHYTASAYRDRVERLRRACPGIAVTTDIIVGFPGETDEDFRETLALMETVKFDGAFSFKYSVREGTAAAGFDGHLDERVKGARLTELQALQERHTLERNRLLEGGWEEVLVEGFSRNSRNDVTGRTRSNRVVNFPGDAAMIGKTLSVRIVEACAHSLRGERPGNEEVTHAG